MIFVQNIPNTQPSINQIASFRIQVQQVYHQKPATNHDGCKDCEHPRRISDQVLMEAKCIWGFLATMADCRAVNSLESYKCRTFYSSTDTYFKTAETYFSNTRVGDLPSLAAIRGYTTQSPMIPYVSASLTKKERKRKEKKTLKTLTN